MYWGPHGFSGVDLFLTFVLMSLFWGGLIALALLGLWALCKPRRGPWSMHGLHGPWGMHHREGPWGMHGKAENESMEILKKRYASGEITREEYHRMREEMER